jgi:CDGSH-type Zn-finger protein
LVVPVRALAEPAILRRLAPGHRLEPLEWKIERDRRALLCTCKRTKTPPICDDSHLKL